MTRGAKNAVPIVQGGKNTNHTCTAQAQAQIKGTQPYVNSQDELWQHAMGSLGAEHIMMVAPHRSEI